MKIIQKKCLFTSLLLAMAMTVSLPANAYRGGAYGEHAWNSTQSGIPLHRRSQ